MQTLPIVAVFAALAVTALSAQTPSTLQSAPPQGQRPQNPEPLRLVLPPNIWTTPQPTKLGVLTLTTPDSQSGEFVKVRLPVGELAIEFSRKIAEAKRERAERKASERVERDLDRFLAQQH